MTLYYAMGGGLGHLTRARVYLLNKGIKDFRVLTGHPASGTVFPSGLLWQVPADMFNDSDAIHQWLGGVLNHPGIDHLIIDTFINGILGEINRELLQPHWEITYITRRMKWEKYASKGEMFPVHQVVMLESLQLDHYEYIKQLTGNISEWRLDYSQVAYDKPDLTEFKNVSQPIWLVIHSEPYSEVEELLAYAHQKAEIENIDPYYLLISNCAAGLPGKGKTLQYFPGWAYYPVADCLITGCGFNSMRLPVPESLPHYFLPFPRKYDDQHWRARQKILD